MHRQRNRWHAQRDAIAADVSARGFNTELGSYTRVYGSTGLDAALLVLPLLDFEAADSTRVRATVDTITRELGAGGSLVYRYLPGRTTSPGAKALASDVVFMMVVSACPFRWPHAHPVRTGSYIVVLQPRFL